MMDEPLWGEIPPPEENVLGLTQAEREALCRLPAVPKLEGPKLYQPQEDQSKLKYALADPDPIVINTIKLLSYKRQLVNLIDTVEQYKVGIANGEMDKMPPLATPPPPPELKPVNINTKRNLFGQKIKVPNQDGVENGSHPEACRVQPVELPEIGLKQAKVELTHAVIKLSAHVGYETADNRAIKIMTDATDIFFNKFCSALRRAKDREMLERGGGCGWPDIVEKVCAEMEVGSVLNLHDYYDDHVIKYFRRIEEECKDLEQQYHAELGWSITQHDVHIPEMHFPSTDDGAVDGLASHASSSLDAGMRMLQSLEASGDLGTPLSSDVGEALSNQSCPTPSPSVGLGKSAARSGSPQQLTASARKRQKSNHKFS